ncbi:hypothetical protein Bpfe_012271 [Biomphalaria pfeifferi]|uniref:C-type lectin domain-containing protein n=1 Tax=Biomphalaria pfeifferi TaxID=112525 RepID=A0AAD8BPB4_BIOPF|nr:hypothetical protein Bpfe_012271 [Biomphalaria pfeifferi]
MSVWLTLLVILCSSHGTGASPNCVNPYSQKSVFITKQLYMWSSKMEELMSIHSNYNTYREHINDDVYNDIYKTYFRIENNIYLLSRFNAESINEASVLCAVAGGYLVEISTNEELKNIKSAIKDVETMCTYVGQSWKGDLWMYAYSQKSAFIQALNIPTFLGKNRHKCAAMLKGNGTLFEFPCQHAPCNFLCEIENYIIYEEETESESNDGEDNTSSPTGGPKLVLMR